MKLILIINISFLICFWQSNLKAFTVFSAKDKKGHVWAGNNEDFDGERKLDPGNNDIVTVGGVEYNRIIIKN